MDGTKALGIGVSLVFWTCLGFVSPVQALLVGDTIGVEIQLPGMSGSLTTIVTPDDSDLLSFLNIHGDHRLEVDPSESGATFTFNVKFPPDLIELRSTDFLEITDLDWLPNPGQVTGVAVKHKTAMVFDTTFTRNSVRVNFNSGFWAPKESLVVDLETEHTPGPTAVPEPNAMLLLASGFVGLIGYRKWNKT